MNMNWGWKATASAPTVHIHGRSRNSSRRKRNTQSTVAAPKTAESRRMSSSRARMSDDGESQYGTASRT